MSVFQANAQTVKDRQDFEDAVQITTDFDENRGELTFSANNRDFCDYYLYVDMSHMQGFLTMGAGQIVTVHPGQQRLFTLKTNPDARKYSFSYRYTMYRGDVKAKPNADFIYALPCTSGNTVIAAVEKNQEGYQLSFELSSDTLYACRGGAVCDDDLKDFTAKGHQNFSDSRWLSQITLYHEDRTFGEYIFFGKPLISAGSTVKMGSPIAVINSNTTSLVKFSTYFLDKNKVDQKNIGNKHTHFRPFFQIANEGKIRLETNKSYVCEITDEMLMQDMSKREKKKFLQKKEVEK
ncbi:hypothetical protein AGMMS50262_18730 [Bacteroidia bacterium]|nr:hypothetical protein AGMMS50262_18730 [Bacteroidia bacterium]